jgi:hypothetical protein
VVIVASEFLKVTNEVSGIYVVTLSSFSLHQIYEPETMK